MLLLLLRSLFAAIYFRSVSVSGTLLITLTLPIERKVGEEEAVAVESSCIMHAHLCWRRRCAFVVVDIARTEPSCLAAAAASQRCVGELC